MLVEKVPKSFDRRRAAIGPMHDHVVTRTALVRPLPRHYACRFSIPMHSSPLNGRRGVVGMMLWAAAARYASS